MDLVSLVWRDDARTRDGVTGRRDDMKQRGRGRLKPTKSARSRAQGNCAQGRQSSTRRTSAAGHAHTLDVFDTLIAAHIAEVAARPRVKSW